MGSANRSNAPLLTPAAYARLKERVDIELAETNPLGFAMRPCAPDRHAQECAGPAREDLRDQCFQPLPRNWPTLNLAVNLDGLVASVARRVEYEVLN